MRHGDVVIDSEHSSFREQARDRINEREDEVNKVTHYRPGGRGFKPRLDHHSGPLNN